MSIEKDIQSKGFLSLKEKSYVNLIYTGLFFYGQSNLFFKKFNLSEPSYNALRILRGSYPEALLSSDLQSRLLHKSSNATRLLEKLEQRTLIRTTQCSIDKRQYYRAITEKGLLLLKKIDLELKDHCTDVIQLDNEKLIKLNLLLDELRDLLSSKK